MNTTDGIFSKYERDELNKITAKSILEKLMNIRQKINSEFIARRLVWELIQNAKDNVSLCNSNKEKVDIKILISNDTFTFSHNKGYFTNEHIRGLIRKYSSSDKNRDADELGNIHKATGRFGTGFMTTHLLSERVKIISNYKNDMETYNPFSFLLNRSGKDEKEIIKGINEAFEEAELSILSNSSIQLDKMSLETSFTYPLSEKNQPLAEIAFEEVRKGIAYTLINVPEISSVTLSEDLIGEIRYSIQNKDTIFKGKNEGLIFNLQENGKETNRYFVCVQNERVQIIIPLLYDNHLNSYSIQSLDGSIPRLHLDFPMIGTEDLHLPFIVNSSLFEPTEPRDGVSLINDDENEYSKLNCELVIESVELFEELLSYADQNKNWNDLYNLARIKNPKRHSWIDYDWFKDNVVEAVRNKLLFISIVDIVNGDRVSILNDEGQSQVFFPYAEKEVIRERIWQLSTKIYPQFTPRKEHINHWHEIIWKDCHKLSLPVLSDEIQAKRNLNILADALKGEEKDAIDFLNDYYDLLNLEENHIKDLLADKYEVIPNQLGDLKRKSDLHIDEKIDEELKKACSLVATDPREYLLHKEIPTASKYANIESKIKYYKKNQEDIISIINSIIKENSSDKISEVCDYLASLFPEKNTPEKRTSIFDFSKRIYPDDFSEKRTIFYYDEKIWEESDKKSLFYIVSKIADCKTLEEATKKLAFNSINEFLIWLDTFITFSLNNGFAININREKHPILPNQNGDFCSKENLFLDDGSIDEVLKDISKELGHDFREELLDKSIFLELPENRIYTLGSVADKISAFVKPILRDIDKRKIYKETLKKLYVWMSENKEASKSNFSDLFEKRFLFLEDDDISLNMKKANELDQLLEEHGIETIEELRDCLLQLQNNNNDSQDNELEKINITKEILVSLGISSPEELEEAFKNPVISSRFYHKSTPTIDMFIYAQRLIDRAKQNIIQFLTNHPDYDCTDLEETAPTTLAGILKNGVSIQIVARPSDNGEVIIYYSSEKDTLDSDNSELWVDNDITAPHILTLGRILKSTGINRIPITMN